MKKIILFAVAVFLMITAFAQKSFDTVYMKQGDVNIGSVKSMDNTSIAFVYKNETLDYVFKKDDINKIVFSSGRVQNFAATQNNNNVLNINANADHHNKIAILPFGYINPSQEVNTEMGYQVQSECYTYLSNKAVALAIQDPSTTNAFLGKAGVGFDNIRNFTNAELCNILGVEYIVRGAITSNIKGVSSSGSASYDQKDKGGAVDKNGNAASKSSGSIFSSASSQTNFQTSVLMEIYQDDGKKIFGQDRTSFWQTVDAYKATIQYLLKKSPVYGR